MALKFKKKSRKIGFENQVEEIDFVAVTILGLQNGLQG